MRITHLGKYGRGEKDMLDLSFYKGKKVLVTGHTGFKGTWLCKILVKAGANVVGYSLEPSTVPNLFSLVQLEKDIESYIGDICDFDYLKEVFEITRPEIVFHLAAQPIVRDSYKAPRYTYETNVMGTVNIMECVRLSSSVKSVLNVTTDKVYCNKEWCWGYREGDVLNGYDPYSNSKSCSELITSSYINSFFCERKVAVSTARAGNVIGGGDFASDRIIPDCIRAATEGRKIGVRNAHSVRPYQHVLEPLSVYLQVAARQYEDLKYADCYNIGPDDSDCVTTGDLVEMFCKCWGQGIYWENQAAKNAPHEAHFLKLDCSKVKSVFGWRPRWHIQKAIQMTCQFSRVLLSGGDLSAEMQAEIEEYYAE